MKLIFVFLCITASTTNALANTALVIGGVYGGKGDSVEFWPRRDPQPCGPVESLPFSTFSHSAAVLGSHVYSCGGLADVTTLSECYMVDIADRSGLWHPVAPMKEKRADFSLIEMEPFIVAVGGYDRSYLNLDTIEIFDEDSWSMAEFRLLVPRYGHCAVKINSEEFLVLGGFSTESRPTAMELINIVGGTNDMIEGMTRPRMYVGCTFNPEENRVYVSGGLGTSTLVEYLDLETWEWTKIANLNTGRDGHQMGFIEGKLTVLGGAGHDYDYINSVEQYQPDEDTWETVKSMETARYNMGMVTLNC